jgi:methionyl aminopeptidase
MYATKNQDRNGNRRSDQRSALLIEQGFFSLIERKNNLSSLNMMQMLTFKPAEIESFRKAGKILKECLEMLAPLAKEGITTLELDRIAEEFIVKHGGEPAFKGYHGYPYTLCTSVNEECVHGMPGPRELKDGDIVSLDCGVKIDGLHTDACITVGVGTISAEARHLLDIGKIALNRAVKTIRPGVRMGDVSSAIQKEIESGKCTPIRALTGHGLGRNLHEYPDIPNFGRKGTGPVIPAWTVIAVEPIVSLGSDDIRETGDGWTLVTDDHSLACHFEHTILVTETGCEVLA